MKIQILSDLHLEMLIDRSKAKIEETDADVIVLAGDIGDADWVVEWAGQQAQRMGKPVVFVPGNHEYYYGDMQTCIDEMRITAEGSGVSLLDRDEICINGVRFLGATLWTDYQAYGDPNNSIAQAFLSMNDHRLITCQGRRFSPQDALAIHQQSVDWLQQKLATPYEGPTVVVTHHGPSPQCQTDQFPLDAISAAFWSDLEHMMGPAVDLWIYGHTHHNIDTEISGTRLVSNCCGYRRRVYDMPEAENFDPKCVVEV
ncbi:MAG: metallophosphoesterase [Motiliproteus sp.]